MRGNIASTSRAFGIRGPVARVAASRICSAAPEFACVTLSASSGHPRQTSGHGRDALIAGNDRSTLDDDNVAVMLQNVRQNAVLFAMP
jgi:hypothetical protein